LAGTREVQARQKQQLENSLEECLRNISGVRDARVTLALSGEKLFDDGPSASASVFLTMQPDQTLSPEQASGMAHLVAAAVTGLDDEKVSLVDSTGKSVPRKHKSEGSTDDFQVELQKQLDGYLAGKAQTLLDRTYGPGRGSVTVNAEFDFSQMEVRRTNVGRPGDGETVVVEQKTDENYKKPPQSQQMLGEDDSSAAAPGSEGGSYKKVCEARRFKNDEAMTWNVFKLPRVRRITAAVSIQVKGQEANVKSLMLGALGIDEERGDYLGVATVPGPGPVLVVPPPSKTPQLTAQPLSAWWALVLVVPAFAALGIWAAVPRPRQTSQTLAPLQPALEVCDSQLTSQGAETRPSPPCRWEELARQNPSSASDHLRTLIQDKWGVQGEAR
jgi:flagellar M-ring protein FliF